MHNRPLNMAAPSSMVAPANPVAELPGMSQQSEASYNLAERLALLKQYEQSSHAVHPSRSSMVQPQGRVDLSFLPLPGLFRESNGNSVGDDSFTRQAAMVQQTSKALSAQPILGNPPALVEAATLSGGEEEKGGFLRRLYKRAMNGYKESIYTVTFHPVLAPLDIATSIGYFSVLAAALAGAKGFIKNTKMIPSAKVINVVAGISALGYAVPMFLGLVRGFVHNKSHKILVEEDHNKVAKQSLFQRAFHAYKAGTHNSMTHPFFTPLGLLATTLWMGAAAAPLAGKVLPRFANALKRVEVLRDKVLGPLSLAIGFTPLIIGFIRDFKKSSSPSVQTP